MLSLNVWPVVAMVAAIASLGLIAWARFNWQFGINAWPAHFADLYPFTGIQIGLVWIWTVSYLICLFFRADVEYYKLSILAVFATLVFYGWGFDVISQSMTMIALERAPEKYHALVDKFRKALFLLWWSFILCVSLAVGMLITTSLV